MVSGFEQKAANASYLYFSAFVTFATPPDDGNTTGLRWRGCHNSAAPFVSCTAGFPPSLWRAVRNTSLKFARPLSEDGVAKNKRQKTDGCWHSSTGISPRPMLMGAAHDALRASNARVSLTCLYVIARRVPRPLCGQVGIARSRRGGHGALADRLNADRSYPSALCCAGGLPPGFLCQGAITGRRVERGTRSARPWISSGQNPEWK